MSQREVRKYFREYERRGASYTDLTHYLAAELTRARKALARAERRAK